MHELPVKRDNGEDKLILLDGYLSIDEAACTCCSDCCINILGGSFNSAGDLFFDHTVQDVVIEMPVKNSRTICHGQRVKVSSQVKPAYRTGSSVYRWHMWHERDWLYVDHGDKLGPDLQCGEHCRIFETNGPQAWYVVEFTSCYVDYAQQYGDLIIGPILGNGYSTDMLHVLAEDLEIAVDKDCCPYLFECKPCHWYFKFIGDPTGPELTKEGITYWNEVDGWALKMVLGRIDKDTKRIGRGDQMEANGGLRWAYNEYEDWEDFTQDTCWEHINWKDGYGEQRHPRVTLPDFEPALSCWPAVYERDDDPCPDRHRVTYESPGLKFTVGATITECEDDCGDELDPMDPVIKATVTYRNPEITPTITFDIEECPNPDDLDCCDFFCDVGIITVNTVIGNNPHASNPPGPIPLQDLGDDIEGLKLIGISSNQRIENGELSPLFYDLTHVFEVCCKYVKQPDGQPPDDLPLACTDPSIGLVDEILNEIHAAGYVFPGADVKYVKLNPTDVAIQHALCGVQADVLPEAIFNDPTFTCPFGQVFPGDPDGDFQQLEEGIFPPDCCPDGEST